MYVSNLKNLKAFGQGNTKLCDYLNSVVSSNLNYPKTVLQIIEQNGNLINVRTQKSLAKICLLIGKLVAMDNEKQKST